jgi:hypothetical protein
MMVEIGIERVWKGICAVTTNFLFIKEAIEILFFDFS